jgi:hypothetical protein
LSGYARFDGPEGLKNDLSRIFSCLHNVQKIKACSDGGYSPPKLQDMLSFSFVSNRLTSLELNRWNISISPRFLYQLPSLKYLKLERVDISPEDNHQPSQDNDGQEPQLEILMFVDSVPDEIEGWLGNHALSLRELSVEGCIEVDYHNDEDPVVKIIKGCSESIQHLVLDFNFVMEGE